MATRVRATDNPLLQQIRQNPEKLHRSRNPQPTPLRHSLREVLRVVSLQPIRLRLHRRQQHRHIGLTPSQPRTRQHRLQLRKRNHLRLGQCKEPPIVLDQLIRRSRILPLPLPLVNQIAIHPVVATLLLFHLPASLSLFPLLLPIGHSASTLQYRNSTPARNTIPEDKAQAMSMNGTTNPGVFLVS